MTKGRSKSCGRTFEFVPGKPAPCGKCNACISRRVTDWATRCIMEKATSKDCLILCLTYGNETAEARKGSRSFITAHIQRFTQNLRDKVDDALGEQGGIRFLIAGEMGEKKGRVHWHAILFSQVDLTTIGTWSAWGEVLTERSCIVTGPGEKAQNRVWSEWPHGFVTAQEPDYGGMRYATAYIIKSQFGIGESKGTMREAKSSFDSAGILRPSRGTRSVGPIGVPYCMQHLGRLAEIGNVDPVPALKPPGRDFPWYATGSCRKVLLAGYRQINDAVRASTGRDCPAWSSLLHHCRDNEPDLKLLGVIEPERLTAEDVEMEEQTALARRRDDVATAERVVYLRQCGSTLPCPACLKRLSDQDAASLGLILTEEREAFPLDGWLNLGGDTMDGRWQDEPRAEVREAFRSLGQVVGRMQTDAKRSGPHPFCALRDLQRVRRAFPAGASGS